ncbi:MAG: MBL fold metallo-hydrolase [bacterium]
MEFVFLGTAAAEGYPAPFCLCENCRRARSLGGKDIRSRAALIVDERILIDWGPDISSASQRVALPLAGVQTLLITHSHADHLYPSNFSLRERRFGCVRNDLPDLTVIGNEASLRIVEDFLEEKRLEANYDLKIAQPFERIVAGDYGIHPLRATHKTSYPDEVCLIYAISRDSVVLLYGCDTGVWEEDVWEYIASLGPLDCVILDETMGTGSYGYHLNIEQFLVMRDQFEKRGLLKERARFFAHHFSHNCNPHHEGLEEIFRPHNTEVAYDGLKIEI